MNEDHTLTLMAVHAHPDDEAIVTGGVLARAADEGIRTVLVCCTRGETGEILNPSFDPADLQGDLGQTREAELRRACEILHVGNLELLGYRDSGMAGTAENEDPRAFANADPEEVAGRMAAIIRRAQPDVVVTYDEKGGYGHPDHIAAHRAAVAGIEAAADPNRFPDAGSPWRVSKLYYMSWSRSNIRAYHAMLLEAGEPSPFGDEFVDIYGVDDEDITTRVDITPYVEQKVEALRAHRSQVSDNDPLLAVHDKRWTSTMGIESFMRVNSTVPAPTPEDDLFAGLR